MTPDAARASYRRQIAEHGEPLTIRRINASPAPATDVEVRGKIINATPEDLASNLTTADRRIVILAEDLEGSPFPLPLVKNDKVVVRGRTLNIQSIDEDVRRVAGILVAYEIVARG